MTWVTVATFNDPAPAEPLKKRLAQAGIHAEVHDQSKLEKLWFVRQPLAGVRLHVQPNDFERALALLHRWDAAEGVLREAVRCPECRSSRIEYPQFTRKFILPNLVGLFANIGLMEKEFYCEDCHYTWPKEGEKRSRVRPHMAPYYFIEGIEQRTTNKV